MGVATRCQKQEECTPWASFEARAATCICASAACSRGWWAMRPPRRPGSCPRGRPRHARWRHWPLAAARGAWVGTSCGACQSCWCWRSKGRARGAATGPPPWPFAAPPLRRRWRRGGPRARPPPRTSGTAPASGTQGLPSQSAPFVQDRRQRRSAPVCRVSSVSVRGGAAKRTRERTVGVDPTARNDDHDESTEKKGRGGDGGGGVCLCVWGGG